MKYVLFTALALTPFNLSHAQQFDDLRVITNCRDGSVSQLIFRGETVNANVLTAEQYPPFLRSKKEAPTELVFQGKGGNVSVGVLEPLDKCDVYNSTVASTVKLVVPFKLAMQLVSTTACKKITTDGTFGNEMDWAIVIYGDSNAPALAISASVSHTYENDPTCGGLP